MLLLFSSITAAWPWPPSLEVVEGLILRRQNSSSSTVATGDTKQQGSDGTLRSTASATAAASSGSGTLTASTSGSATASGKSSNSGSATNKAGSVSGSNNATKTTDKSAATTAIDPRLPAGGVQMVTPGVLAGAQYYKVGDFVTFGWNYTSLSVTPSAVDILASCSLNDNTYTIATNVSVGPTGSVTWDTAAHQTQPFLTETYTLVIYDAAKDVTSVPQAGHLGVYDQFTFGMYIPQAYTPLNQFQCATCSAALSDMERQALGFMLGMSVITVLSFTWFVGGLGVVF
ncbi:MAG: hypothetical protein M1827_005874 [Pycnora praestabilis]|nr:MAG: hypothetical protein M1827_005874 [Pycnora praestabilis]